MRKHCFLKLILELLSINALLSVQEFFSLLKTDMGIF